MQIFWAIVVSVILLLIICGIVNSKIQKRKPISIGNIKLKQIDEVLSPEKRYHIVLNSGTKFESMRIMGFAEAVGGPDSQVVWSSRRWLILEDIGGSKMFVSPYRIIWMKEAEQKVPLDAQRPAPR